MSIEFGILRPGSSNTLLAKHRVDMGEDDLRTLAPVLQQIQDTTGIEIDPYGSAAFDGTALDAVIMHLRAAAHRSEDEGLLRLVAPLLAVAEQANAMGAPLSYFGL